MAEINYRRHGSRYRARRRAADILYEAENRDIDPVAIVEDRIALHREDPSAVAPVADYTQEIIAGAAAELDTIDETIARYLSEDWELHRLPAVDRAILRVAVWELLYNPDVPVATAVVEGVELASEYSTEKASPYIHAVLDDVAQSKAEGNPMAESSEPGDAESDDAEPGVAEHATADPIVGDESEETAQPEDTAQAEQAVTAQPEQAISEATDAPED